MSKILNSQFSRVFTKEDLENIPEMSSDPTPGLGSLIIAELVLKQLSSLNPNKAYGPDQIPPWFLKTFDADIAPILTENFQDSIINWLELFLTQRFQSVVCEGQASSQCPVTFGVPHGTVLGPLLSLLYTNDSPDNVQSSIRIFKDDALL